MATSALELVNWHEQISCLLTKCLVAPLVSIDELDTTSDGNISASGCAILAQSLSLDQLTRCIAHDEVIAIIIQNGSLADHTAGLANARGIQLVIAPHLAKPPEPSFVLIDGIHERLALTADKWTLKTIYDGLQQEIGMRSTSNMAEAVPTAVLVDGSKSSELCSGLAQGATGIGILRSEWIGWSDSTIPSSDLLLTQYKEAALAVQPYRLNIRLFDLGDAKIPRWAEPYADLLQSPLGFRGIRAFAHLSKAFESQFRAVVDCADFAPIGIVLPMVTDTNDILEAKALLSKFASPSQLRDIAIGAMIEVPSAALTINEIVNEIDFIRIGPGDLSQFTLAKLRRNISPKDFSGKGFHPAVLDLIEYVGRNCSEANKEVTICLDVEPRAALIESLLARNVRRFAAPPLAIGVVLARIADVLAEQHPI